MACALWALAATPGARAATALWDGGAGAGNEGWGNATNWVGDTAAGFGNALDVYFYQAGAGNRSHFLGAARTLRSLTFNDDVDSAVTVRFTTSLTGTTGANLIFWSDTGTSQIVVSNGASAAITLGASTGNMVLSNNLTIAHDGTGELLINRVIADRDNTQTVTKNGSGLLTLSQANTFGGGFILNAGRVRVGNNGALGNMGTITLNGGTLSANSGVARTLALSYAIGGDLTLGNATDTGALIFSGTGDMGSALRTLAIDSAVTFSNTVGGAGGGLVKTGAGTLTLAGANTYSGGTTVSEGTLILANTGAKPASGTITVGAGAGLALGVGGAGSFTVADVDSLWADTLAGVSMHPANGVGIDTSAGDFIYSTSQSTRGLIKLGANTLILNSANTYPGGTLLSAGTLRVGNDDALGTGPLSFLAAASTLAPYGGDRTISNAIGRGDTNDYTVTIATDDGNLTLLGAVNYDSGASNNELVKSGSSNLVIRGGMTLGVNNGLDHNAGRITIDGCTLTMSDGYRLQATGTNTSELVITNGGRLVLDANVIVGNTTNGTLHANRLQISSGELVMTGAGELMIGDEQYGELFQSGGAVRVTNTTSLGVIFGTAGGEGVYHLDGGVLQTFRVAPGSATAGPGTLSFNGGTLMGVPWASMVVTGIATAVQSGGAILDTAGADAIVYPGLADGGGGGGLTKLGAGTLALASTNTYGGGTDIRAGTLQAANAAALPGYAAPGMLAVSNGATLAVNYGGGSDWTSANVDSLLANSSAFAAGSSLGFDTSNGNGEYAGAIPLAGLGVVKLGANTLTLSGANTFDGGVTIDGGTLNVTNDAALGAAGGGLTLNGGTLQTSGDMTLNNRTITLAGAGTNSVDGGTALTISNSISGAGTLTKAGAGLMILSGASTGAGTTVNAGTLRISASERLADNGILTVNNGGVFDLNGNCETIAWLVGSAGGLVTNSAATRSVLAMNLGASGIKTYTGNIAGDVQVLVQNSTTKNTDVQVLAGTNTYTGGTIVDGGQLRVAFDLRLGAVPAAFDAANLVLRNGGVLQNNNSDLVLDPNRGVYLENGEGVIYAGWTSNLVINGTVSGPGTLVKRDTGALWLMTGNTYAGGTVLTTGTLRVAADLALGSGPLYIQGASTLTSTGAEARAIANPVSVSNTFTLGATAINTGALTFSGPMDLGGAMRTLNVSSPVLINGVIDNGGLTKTGTSTLTLSGPNTHAGGTTVSAGTLLLGNENALGSGLLTMSGGTLSSDGLLPRTITNAVSVTAASTFGHAVNAGPLSLSGPISLNGAVRNLTVASEVVFAGIVTNGSFNKQGAGTLVMQGMVNPNAVCEVQNGTLWLDGATVVSGGGFRPDATGAGNTARIIVGNGASLTVGGGSSIRVGFGASGATNIYDFAGSATATISGQAGLLLYKSATVSIANLLPGGVLTVNDVAVDGTGANNTYFNFDGGILRAALNTNAFISGIGAVTVRAGGAAIDSGGYNVTVSQPLLDGGGHGGLTKLGAGTLQLGAVNLYMGDTVVSNGTLQLGASGSIGNSPLIHLSSLGSTVDVTAVSGGFHLVAGQQLKGVGTVQGGLIMDPGAQLNPGNSAGTLRVSGNLTLATGTTNYFELTPGDLSDRVDVVGGLNLNGVQFADFAFTLSGGPLVSNAIFTLVHADGGVSGVLGAVTNGAVGSYDGYLSRSGNDLQLTVVPEPGTVGLLGLFAVAALLRRRPRGLLSCGCGAGE